MTDPPSARSYLLRLLVALWDPQQLSLPSELPWAEVVHLARSERVASPLRAAVHRAGIPLPLPAQTSLEQIHHLLLAVDTHRRQDLKRVLATLSGVQVPVLLLKGAALAETLYKGLALRVTGDLDLAVPHRQSLVCREILTDLGYTPTEIELATGAHLAYRNEQAFAPPESGFTTVEIHWHLLDLPYYLRKVPMDWFWQNTTTTKIAGQDVQVLNAEANLLYLSAHLALHHRFHGLRWFLDLGLLVSSYTETLDWDRLAAAAQQFELLLVLRETLDRLADHWPSLPLEGPRRQLHDLQPTPLERRLFRLLTAEPRSPLLDFYTDVVCLPGVPDRARFVWQNLFPQRTYMEKRYGVRWAWELPYWYLYRLGDGLAKLARTLPQAFRLDREP